MLHRTPNTTAGLGNLQIGASSIPQGKIISPTATKSYMGMTVYITRNTYHILFICHAFSISIFVFQSIIDIDRNNTASFYADSRVGNDLQLTVLYRSLQWQIPHSNQLTEWPNQ